MLCKLLIAEDERSEREYLASCISTHYQNGIELVGICADGEKALAEGLASEPDIALLDIEMPKMNGLDVARILKGHKPDMQIVMITAYGTFDYAKQALLIGVKDYLVKPYEDLQLFATIDNILTQLKGEKKREISRIVTLLNTTSPNTEKNPIVRLVNTYIDEHFAEKISLEIMSEDLGFSSSYVSKCIKQYMHTGFTQLLMDKRCNAAAKLLYEKHVTVNEAAYAVGFSDPNYFYKCFKEQFGVQPKKYVQAVLGRCLPAKVEEG